MKYLILRMIHRKLILRSRRTHDTALESVNYAQFIAVSRVLRDQELPLFFKIIRRNFVKTINYYFSYFFIKSNKNQKSKI